MVIRSGAVAECSLVTGVIAAYCQQAARQTPYPRPVGPKNMDVTQVHDQLKQRAFLHSDPDAYLAGVDDALAVVTSLEEPAADEDRTIEAFGA